MEAKIKSLKEKAFQALEEVSNPEQLEKFRIDYLGKKGKVTLLFRKLGKLPPEQRPEMGKLLNEFRDNLTRNFEQKKKKLVSEPSRKHEIDLSLPSRKFFTGGIHPINQIIDDVVKIFIGMGFQIADGPDIETEYHNFDALNTPPDHPARELQDTFYMRTCDYLLRTHTSPVQIRFMENHKPPVRIIAPGKCYRRDTIDSTHYVCFHQIEGLYVDKNVTLADLKGVLTQLARELMGPKTKIRFRPHFFPFTEPSVEYDFSCPFCDGKGCRICKNQGWIEISGAGMVDPEVFKAVKYDPEKWRGYAFGMGIERIAMIKYNIDDIRLFYENDIRFLQEFNRLTL